LFLSKQDEGQLLYHQLIQAMQIVALIVGVPLTLLANAPRLDSQIKTKALTRIARTRAKSK